MIGLWYQSRLDVQEHVIYQSKKQDTQKLNLQTFGFRLDSIYRIIHQRFDATD